MLCLSFRRKVPMSELLLEMENITKTFIGVKANDNVNLKLYSGEIHALLGENGAGKSTLMSVLTGVYKPDYGNIYFRGKKVDITNPKHAVDLGIGMVYQHFRLIPTLTVTENVLLNSGDCPRILNVKEMNDTISACSDQFNLKIIPEAKVWQLSVGEQQRVEIVKLLYRGAEILILDEPSAVLTPQESVEMFKTLRLMADSGKAVVFISHKMNEVMANADRITVLQAGKSVASMPASVTDRDELTRLMVGHEVEWVCNSDVGDVGKTILKCEDMEADNDRGLPALKKACLDVHAGEILGVAGVAGNGQKMLAEVITGLRELKGGKVFYKEEDISKSSVKHRNMMGISFVPEDRLGMGLIPSMNLMDNLVLKKFFRPAFSNKGILKKQDIQKATNEIVEKYDIKNAGIHREVGKLSGGNQQKLLMAREISGQPDLIVVMYPSRGLDIAASMAIHEIVLQQKKNGAAVLMISEELDEIFELSDRIVVMNDGYVSDPIAVGDATKESIGRLMAGIGLGAENPDAKEAV